MAIEFAKVLNELGKPFICIGRGGEKAEKFHAETKIKCTTGGLDEFLKSKPPLPEFVFVTVSVESLTSASRSLLKYGVMNMLVEKPGVSMPDEILELSKLARQKKANVFIAYNRRFYASTIEAQKIIKEDGGVLSFAFEFTEWSHKIQDLKKHPIEHNYWFLGNSTHVIDTSFYLAGGLPKKLNTFVKGKDQLAWHPASSMYTGAGETVNGALFSYHANWQAPGRWVIEIFTRRNRLIFKPLEKLQVQKLGSVEVNFAEGIDYTLDEKFKPGVFIQVRKFLDKDYKNLCTLQEQETSMRIYKKMSGY